MSEVRKTGINGKRVAGTEQSGLGEQRPVIHRSKFDPSQAHPRAGEDGWSVLEYRLQAVRFR